MANNPVIRKIKIADVVYDLKDGSVEEQINAALSNLGENLDIDHPVYVAEESVDTSAEVINADTLGGHPADSYATKEYVDELLEEGAGAPSEMDALLLISELGFTAPAFIDAEDNVYLDDLNNVLIL